MIRKHSQSNTLLSRRRFITACGLGLASAAFVGIAPTEAAWLRPGGSRILAFHNLHTDERLRIVWWRDGRVDRNALAKINHILRDHRAGLSYPMHTGMLETLNLIQSRLGNGDGGTAFEVISGYRSPKSNSMLVKSSGGVARKSYHMKGMAIDIRLPGASLLSIRNTALDLQRGGVGYYPLSDFVHVDAGPVRRW